MLSLVHRLPVAYSTCCSWVVTHLSTDQGHCCLTSLKRIGFHLSTRDNNSRGWQASISALEDWRNTVFQPIVCWGFFVVKYQSIHWATTIFILPWKPGLLPELEPNSGMSGKYAVISVKRKPVLKGVIELVGVGKRVLRLWPNPGHCYL